MEKNYADSSWGVKEMRESIGYSQPQFYRIVKQLTQFSPSQFLMRFRLEKAIELLESSSTTIREIAFATGFGEPGYFSKRFKEYLELTPSQYREKNQAES